MQVVNYNNKYALFRFILSLFLFAYSTQVLSAGLANNRGLMINRPDVSSPKLPDYLPDESAPSLNLPQASPVEDSEDKNIPLSQTNTPRLELKGVIFEGNHVFSSDELTLIAQDFIGQSITMADLEELRYRLTRYYTDKGYSNSGAMIKPGQIVKDGQVTFLIHEGVLEKVIVSGTERLSPEYVAQRIWPDEQTIFNTHELQENFQMMLNDPMIERIDGRLIPGVEPGSALLELDVERAKPYSLRAIVDNTNSPSTGSEHARLIGTIYNLTSLGDRLDLESQYSRGVTEWAVNFSLPINRYDTRLSVRYDTTESRVVKGPLSGLDIENKYDTFELGLSHPLWKDLYGHLLLGATLSLRENQSFLLGEAFPFSPSDDDKGTSSVSVLRLWQDYQQRTTNSVLALRSTLSIGLDAFGATDHSGQLPDGQFVAWLGQVQYAQKVIQDAQFVVRADLQLSNDRLLSLEQFSLGGMDTIRGYRENTLVRDQAFMASLEFRYPVLKNIPYGHFEMVPFIDFGRAWNYSDYKEKDDLIGAGIGLTWQLKDRLDAALYIAHDIKNASDYPDHNLQDDGIHFRVNFKLF